MELNSLFRYRAPELLYGARAYGTGVDLWAAGCIIAELLLRVRLSSRFWCDYDYSLVFQAPFFQGESDLDQLIKIYQVLGSPTDNDWPNITSLPNYIKIVDCGPGHDLRTVRSLGN